MDALTAFESKLVSLLALQLVQERSQPDQIALLARAGFKPAEVAVLLNTTANSVSVQLSKMKRQRRTGRKSAPKKKKK